mgnify:CR=1 FL=1
MTKDLNYEVCSNTLLMLWMDNILTDGEYNRIMDKLNAYTEKEMESDNEVEE